MIVLTQMTNPTTTVETTKTTQRIRMYREALNEAIAGEMRRDQTVFVMGCGIANRGGSYKVTENLLKEFGRDRVIDTPLAEAGFTGMGIGAALTGMRPIVEILYVDFAMLCMEILINHAAKYKLMTGGQARVPLVFRTQGGVGNGVAAQHSQSLEQLFYHIPGLRLVMPSTPYDAKGLLIEAIRMDEPVVFMEHKLLYMDKGEVPDGPYTIPFGKGIIRREGRDLTIIAWSKMVPRCLEAAEALASMGIEAEVVDPRTLVPLDEDLLIQSVQKTEHVLIVQEAVRRGGVASDIASIIQSKAFDYLDAPIEILAGMNCPAPFNLNLEKCILPQQEDIIASAKKAVGK